jgi:hypothetical protein
VVRHAPPRRWHHGRKVHCRTVWRHHHRERICR